MKRKKGCLAICRNIFLLSSVWLLAVEAVFCAFNDEGWGARPYGMGGAFTAVADDSNAALYNPAGITQVTKIEATFMYAKLFTGLTKVDLGQSYGAVVVPVNNRLSLGLLWANFISANQYREDTFAVTGAYDITSDLSLGLNVKALSHGYTLDERTFDDVVFANGSSRTNFTFDVGAFYNALHKEKYDVLVGVAGKNINRPDVGLASFDPVPPEIRVGVSFDIRGKVGLTPAIDYSYRYQDWGDDADKMNINAGLEARFFHNILALRAGANFGGATVGTGVTARLGSFEVQIDYAIEMPFLVQDTSGNHRLAMTIRFGR